MNWLCILSLQNLIISLLYKSNNPYNRLDVSCKRASWLKMDDSLYKCLFGCKINDKKNHLQLEDGKP